MGVLDSVLKLKALEREKQLKDIDSISGAVDIFVKAKANASKQQLAQFEQDRAVRKEGREIESLDLTRRNIESKIKERDNPDSVLDQLSDLNIAFTSAKNTGNTELGEQIKVKQESLLGQFNTGQKKAPIVPQEPEKEPPVITPDMKPITIRDEDTGEEKQIPTVVNGVELSHEDAVKESLGARGFLPEPKDVFGQPTEQAVKNKRLNDHYVKLLSNDADVQKQMMAQFAKDREKGFQDLTGLDLRVDNTMGIWAEAVALNQELSDVPPGPINGVIGTVLGKIGANKFMPALEGALIQMAAATARVSMPGTRAIRAIDIFKKTTVTRFMTMEQAIETAAFDYQNALSNDMKIAAHEYLGMSKKQYQALPVKQRIALTENLKKMKNTLINDYTNNMEKAFFKSNPQMFKEATRAKIALKFPEFKSIDEATANLKPGDIYRIGNDIMEVD